MTGTDPPGRRRRWPAFVGSAICGLAAVASLLPAAFSVMMFDAPGSEDNPLTVALVVGLLAAPVVLLLSAALLGLGAARRSRRIAFVTWCLPGLLVAFLAAVTIALDRVCGGSFACR